MIAGSTYYADGNFLLRTGLTFFLCLLPGRIFKRKAAEKNYDAEMKSTFVSFMNHEMRTPLNIVRKSTSSTFSRRRVTNLVEVGLSLLVRQIQNKCSTATLLETATDVEHTCVAATVVLDNLLLYEKLDKGALQLDYEETYAIPFLYSALEDVADHVKDLRATLSVLAPNRSDIDVLRNVMVRVDKQLLSSQLLKFAKRALQGTDENDVVYIDMGFPSLSSRKQRNRLRLTHRVLVNPENACLDVVRISIKLKRKLSAGEKIAYKESKLNFIREANEGEGGTYLSGWIAQRVISEHGGTLKFAQDGGAIYVDIPCLIHSEPASIGDIEHARRCFIQQSVIEAPVDPIVSETSRALLHHMASDAWNSNQLFQKTSAESTEGKALNPSIANVLVVDDSMMNRKMMTRLMTSLGFVCDEAENGQVCVDRVRASLESGRPYELVLLDNG